MNERDKELAVQAGWIKEAGEPDAGCLNLERLVELVRADEQEACSKDADWCIQNHLEHLIPERIRARSTT